MNARLLKARMLENKVTIEEMAKMLSIHPATLYRKISNNTGSFTIKEAYEIVEILGLCSKDAISIFFENSVADKRHNPI